MNMFILITISLLCIALFFTSFRLIKGPTVWDRVMALNLIAVKIVLIITLYAVYKNNLKLLDVSVTCSIIGFLTVTLISRFILRGGRLK